MFLRKARQIISGITKEHEFDLTKDSAECPIPKSMRFERIVIAATKVVEGKLFLFSHEKKVIDANDDDFSLLVELEFGKKFNQIGNEFIYLDEDVAANVLDGIIHGKVVLAGKSSETNILIDFYYQ